jgi:hypothetical protein
MCTGIFRLFYNKFDGNSQLKTGDADVAGVHALHPAAHLKASSGR